MVIFVQARIVDNFSFSKIYKFEIFRVGKATKLSKDFSKSKLNELPQLLNIIKGEILFKGPKPAVPGYYDKLVEIDRLILTLRPGVTCRAANKNRE